MSAKDEGLLFFIPSKLDVDLLLKNHPPENISKFDRDNLIYILSLPTRIASYNKDLITWDGMVPINSTYTQAIVRNYNEYLDYLLKADVFISDDYFIKGEKSRCYRFADSYLSIVQPITIDKKSIIKHKERILPVMSEETMQNYPHLAKWWTSDLMIDADAAMDYNYNVLKNDPDQARAILRFNANYINIHKLINSQYSFHQDNNIRRLHTSLTLMSSGLRHFITYAGETLIELDISNCQPYLSTVLLHDGFYTSQSNTLNLGTINYTLTKGQIRELRNIVVPYEGIEQSDIKYYSDIVYAGRLYEYMQQLYAKDISVAYLAFDKRKIKDAVFSVIYSDNRCYSLTKQTFKKYFPVVHEIFATIKRKKNNTLALMLQSMESRIVLDIICQRIALECPEAVLYTIHDSLVTTRPFQSLVADIMVEELTNAVGMKPIIKVKPWTPDNLPDK